MTGFFVTGVVVLLLTLDVYRLKALRTLFDIKVDCLSFSQSLEAVTVDCRKMHEYIFATIGRCNKTETILFIETFNSTFSNVTPLY